MLLLVQVLVVCLVTYGFCWVVGTIPVPSPPGPVPTVKVIVQIAIVLVACIVLLEISGLFGPPHRLFS